MNVVDWSHIAVMVGLVVVANGGFVWAVKWLLTRDRKMLLDDINQVSARVDDQEEKSNELSKELSRMRECLPIDYVRREDWIRGFSQIDFKIDAIWAFIRDKLR